MLPQWIEFTEEEERAIEQIWAEIGREEAEAGRAAERPRERLRIRHHNELRERRRRERECGQEQGQGHR